MILHERLLLAFLCTPLGTENKVKYINSRFAFGLVEEWDCPLWFELRKISGAPDLPERCAFHQI